MFATIPSFFFLSVLFEDVVTEIGSLDVKWMGTETGKVCPINYLQMITSNVILHSDFLCFILGGDRGVPGQGHMARGGMAGY